MLHFRLNIMPDEGYYRGGIFPFSFTIPHEYPHAPPKVKCLKKIYHPNIDLDGNVCLNILREDWKPVLNLNSVMVGLQYLFLEPNPEDPLNKEAAKHLREDKKGFAQAVTQSMRGYYVGQEQFDNVLRA